MKGCWEYFSFSIVSAEKARHICTPEKVTWEFSQTWQTTRNLQTAQISSGGSDQAQIASQLSKRWYQQFSNSSVAKVCMTSVSPTEVRTRRGLDATCLHMGLLFPSATPEISCSGFAGGPSGLSRPKWPSISTNRSPHFPLDQSPMNCPLKKRTISNPYQPKFSS